MYKQVIITANSSYSPTESSPEQNNYKFNYFITITNNNTAPIQLLSRHWYITNANGEITEVQGTGVIGQQPKLAPQSSFSYTSSASITTPVGSMHGSYYFIDNNGEHFEVLIKPFSLAVPNMVN